MSRIVSWFSCGAASAVATKKAIEKYGKENFIVACCVVANEHPDNERFLQDCEKWFGLPVLRLKSDKYADCWEVWEKTKFLVGPFGARCTLEMKKAVRNKFQRVSDIQIFGFTKEEQPRAERFKENNPEVNLETPLIELGISKNNCFNIIQEVGIELPAMYKLGYRNNNCIGCVKASGVAYWLRTKKHFPEVFERMAKLERTLGYTVVKYKGERIYLDEIPDSAEDKQEELNMECGLWCKEEA